MKPIVMHEMGTVMPKTVAALKGDGPLMAIVGTRDMVHYFNDWDFVEVKDFSKPLPPLGVVTKFRFKPVREGRIVATDTIMLGTCTSKFARNFRRGTKDRMAIGLGMSPEKMWDIFKNLGISYEVFGRREEFQARFCLGYMHPRGFWVQQGMKDLAGLSSVVRPYVQLTANAET